MTPEEGTIPTTRPDRARLSTVSLRRRVIVTALVVVTLVLAGVVVAVTALFAAQTRRDVGRVLRDRAQVVRQLAGHHVPPDRLVVRANSRTVRVRLVLPGGQTFGSLAPPAGPEQSAEPDRDALARRLVLHTKGRLAGAVVTLSAGTRLLDQARTDLLRTLIVTGLAALALTAGALLAGMRRALAPLDAMTALARRITRGGRGHRLAPARTSTELGRTAAAFDEMLEALEGAETRARDSEARTRRFVADAAHELRTPITGIAATTETLLSAPTGEDRAQRERLELLLIRESRRAGKLVNDLLDLARLDAGLTMALEPVELHALATTEAERAGLRHPDANIAVRGEAATVQADPNRIGQILANLLDNAARHTPPDGHITVAVTTTARGAEVLVSDTGPGVPEPDRERIFDRLTRLDSDRDPGTGGAGLGLAIARGLARAHGGELTCPPPQHAGAAFRLTLPTHP